MGTWATMDTIGSRFRPWLSCEDICWLNTPPNGRHSHHSAVLLLMEPRDNQGTFVPCAARILWYSADKTSSRQLRDTTQQGAEDFIVKRTWWNLEYNNANNIGATKDFWVECEFAV